MPYRDERTRFVWSVIAKRAKPVETILSCEEEKRLQADAARGLAGVTPTHDDSDAAIDRMVESIYLARTKSKGRKPAL